MTDQHSIVTFQYSPDIADRVFDALKPTQFDSIGRDIDGTRLCTSFKIGAQNMTPAFVTQRAEQHGLTVRQSETDSRLLYLEASQ